MDTTILFTVLSLTLLGLVSAVILFFVARKFYVFEDPRIDQVQELLPAANCGGCGFAGCRNFAEALVAAESFDGLNCPVGGRETMENAAKFLGREAVATDPLVAVLKCNGSPEHRARTSEYAGAQECRISHSLYGGDTDCQYGCMGLGDCVRSCSFGAMQMNSLTLLPEITDDKCVACGACVKACPRKLIELRKKAKKDRKIYVACMNCDKGGPARRACKVACIACNKCVNVCGFEAITVVNNLAYIDAGKCTFCRKCAEVCPTGSIIEVNFPPKKQKSEAVKEEITA